MTRSGISAGPDISGRVSTHMTQSAVSGPSIRPHCAALHQQVIAATEKLRTSGHCKQTWWLLYKQSITPSFIQSLSHALNLPLTRLR